MIVLTFIFNWFFSVATGIGDPHMVTLDGVEYTFNGYGEYHILQVPPSGFKLQGRMQPLINSYGRKTHGTVYKAFAMKENGSDIVQVNTGQTETNLRLFFRKKGAVHYSENTCDRSLSFPCAQFKKD